MDYRHVDRDKREWCPFALESRQRQKVITISMKKRTIFLLAQISHDGKVQLSNMGCQLNMQCVLEFYWLLLNFALQLYLMSNPLNPTFFKNAVSV